MALINIITKTDPALLHLLGQIIKHQRMAEITQAELAAQLGDLGVQLGKAKTEITTKFADLEAAIGQQANVSPELQAAFEALKPAVQQIDDLVTDPTPNEGGEGAEGDGGDVQEGDGILDEQP